MPSRRIVRLIFAAAILLVLALCLPLVRFGQLVPPVRAALESALDREVEIGGPVRLRLLPSPALTVPGVVIHDDPEFSVEPLAYVESAELEVHPLALLAGRLALSSLRLIGPSVNLMKTGNGRWNYPTLLNRAFATSPASGARLPLIAVRGGRLNFKSGHTKSVFYLSGVNLDLSADTDSGDALRFRFSASPSRTDRAAQGFGRFSGNGRFQFVEGAENRVRLVARLERSAISDILTLLQGHGAGLSGFLASRAEISGPLSDLRIRGELELAEIDRRFSFLARSGEWSLDYAGRLDLDRQELRARTLAGNQQVPLSARVFLRDYMSSPKWAVVLTADSLRLETLSALAAEMGTPILPGLALQGEISGAVSRSASGKYEGHFRASGIEMRSRDGESLQIEEAEVVSTEGVIRVDSAAVTVDGEPVAMVDGSYDRDIQQLAIGVEGRQFPVARFQDVWGGMTGYPAPPAFSRFEGGVWSGDLRFTATPESDHWDGEVEIEAARLAFPGLAAPIRIARAASPASGGDVEVEGTAGGLDFRALLVEGEVLQLHLSRLDALELESLMKPTLDRRRGLIVRTLRRRPAPLPRWLSRRKIAADVRVDRLDAGALRLYDLSLRLFWNGPVVNLRVLEANARPGGLAGKLRVDLNQAAPRYRLSAQIEDLPWAGGELNAEGRLTTSGAGLELVTHARAEGEFAARPSSRAGFQRVSGCYEFRYAGTLPVVDLPCLRIQTSKATYYGWGTAEAGGSVNLELFNDDGSYRGTGKLHPPALRIRPVPVATLK